MPLRHGNEPARPHNHGAKTACLKPGQPQSRELWRLVSLPGGTCSERPTASAREACKRHANLHCKAIVHRREPATAAIHAHGPREVHTAQDKTFCPRPPRPGGLRHKGRLIMPRVVSDPFADNRFAVMLPPARWFPGWRRKEFGHPLELLWFPPGGGRAVWGHSPPG